MKHNFTLGQKVVWKVSECGRTDFIKGIITEVADDHCIATTEGNHNNNDNMKLWIDEDTEQDFFDAELIAALS